MLGMRVYLLNVISVVYDSFLFIHILYFFLLWLSHDSKNCTFFPHRFCIWKSDHVPLPRAVQGLSSLFASELSPSVGLAGVTLPAVRVRESFPRLVTTWLVISANGRVFAPGTQHLFGVRSVLVTTHVQSSDIPNSHVFNEI